LLQTFNLGIVPFLYHDLPFTWPVLVFSAWHLKGTFMRNYVAYKEMRADIPLQQAPTKHRPAVTIDYRGSLSLVLKLE